ncbi:MAG: response regulator [Eubacteriales bacterium]|nr:response regulator [Eubacteriales bacterium]
MRTILVDDEMLSMRQFEEECRDLPQIELVGKFSRASEALAYANDHRVHFALLDIEMPGMNGIELARELRELYPDIIIVFVTAHSQYSLEALQMKADYFILKPYEREDIMGALERARMLSRRQKKTVFMRTFGTFDMLVDGEPVKFPNARSKELLAFLVDRRSERSTIEQILTSVWAGQAMDSRTINQYRDALAELVSMLDALGLPELVVASRDQIAANIRQFECDYYQYWEDDPAAIDRYRGDYMEGYDWASTTRRALEQKRNQPKN